MLLYGPVSDYTICKDLIIFYARINNCSITETDDDYIFEID
jgi:hypothetical protein